MVTNVYIVLSVILVVMFNKTELSFGLQILYVGDTYYRVQILQAAYVSDIDSICAQPVISVKPGQAHTTYAYSYIL